MRGEEKRGEGKKWRRRRRGKEERQRKEEERDSINVSESLVHLLLCT